LPCVVAGTAERIEETMGVPQTAQEAVPQTAQEVLERTKALRPMLAARADEIDALGRLPQDVVDAMGDAGLYRLRVPKKYGGLAPVSIAEELEILTELARGNASAAWTVSVGRLSENMDVLFGSEVAALVYDSDRKGPALATSTFNASNSEGSAHETVDGYSVTGRWAFASNIRLADWLVAGVTRYDADGSETKGVALLPVDKLLIADDWQVEGMKGSASNTAYTEEPVLVPHDRVVVYSEEFLRESRQALRAIVTHHASIALGSAEEVLEIFVEKARTKAPWNQPYPSVAQMPTAQVAVARAVARIHSARATLTGGAKQLNGLDFVEDIDMFSVNYRAVYSAHRLRESIAELRGLLGSSTAKYTDRVGRIHRDVEVMCLHGALREEWVAERLGRALLAPQN